MGYKEQLIVNAVIDVISWAAWLAKNKDDVPLYFPISLEELASLSNLSVKQIKCILKDENSKIHSVISISHSEKSMERTSYAIDFEKVKELNTLANYEKIYNGLHGEETRTQVLKRLANEAVSRLNGAMSRQKNKRTFNYISNGTKSTT